MLINKGIRLGKSMVAQMAELFRTSILVRKKVEQVGGGYWDRGSANGHGADAKRGMQARAVRKRRRLRDIAHASRKFNQRKAAQ